MACAVVAGRICWCLKSTAQADSGERRRCSPLESKDAHRGEEVEGARGKPRSIMVGEGLATGRAQERRRWEGRGLKLLVKTAGQLSMIR